jgi:hypothetical protein
MAVKRAPTGRAKSKSILGKIGAALSKLGTSLHLPVGGYRAEKHYMRGPGPRTRSKTEGKSDTKSANRAGRAKTLVGGSNERHKASE